MRTVHLAVGFWLLVIILSPDTGGAADLETRFADCVTLRAATMDSISAMVEVLDSDGLLFDTTRERRQYERWVQRLAASAGRAQLAMERFEGEPSLYAAVICEETWRRLTWNLQKTIEYSVALTIYSIVDPTRASPEDALRVYELRAQNRAVGSAAMKQYAWISKTKLDLDLIHGTAFHAYVRAASAALKAAGWSP